MPKLSVEYKTVERDGFTQVTKQAKQVFESRDIVPFDALQGILADPGLEYLVIRKLPDRPVKPEKPLPKVPVKKES